MRDDPEGSRSAIRDFIRSDSRAFFMAALPALIEESDWAVRHYILALLMGRGLLPPCDPTLATVDEEVAVCRLALEQGQQLERKLVFRLLECLGKEGRELAAAERALQILDKISDGTRLTPVLLSLLRQDNQRLRSKAALMLIRATRSPKTAAILLGEDDARVRANAVEALWEVESPEALAIMSQAMRDPDNRVFGNGALALVRRGEPEAVEAVRRAAGATDPKLRATAAWVMGASGDPCFMPQLAVMIRDKDATVRHSVFKAISALKRPREAAVAGSVPS